MTARSFPTLDIASVLTGIGLTPGLNYSKVQDIASWLFGADIFTHELAHAPTMDAVQTEGYRQFPLMPTRESATANFEAAARQAVAIYGKTIMVEQGAHGRREDPVATLQAVAPGKPILIVNPTGDKS